MGGSDWLQPGSNMANWTSRNPDWKPGDPEEERMIVTGHKMLAEFDFLVIKRPGYDVKGGLEQFGSRLMWMEMPSGMSFTEGNLSSTEIRKRNAMKVGRGAQCVFPDGLQHIDGLVDRSVLSFIKRHHLYMVESPVA